MSDKKPEALRLADALRLLGDALTVKNNEAHQAAAELRRLHALSAELVAALQMARRYVVCEGSQSELEQVDAAINAAKEQP
jgi:hypothetical protein